MTNEQLERVFQYLDAMWPQKPLPPSTRAVWATKLARLDGLEVMRALDRLAEVHQWRPGLSAILQAVQPPEPDGTAAKFEQVMGTVMLCPPGERNARVTPDVREAVRRLGGWGAVGRWQENERHWREKDFARVLAEVRESGEARRAELTGNTGRALKGAS